MQEAASLYTTLLLNAVLIWKKKINYHTKWHLKTLTLGDVGLTVQL